jgi:ribokinase
VSDVDVDPVVDVVVVGSVNVDLTLDCEAIPSPGATVLASAMTTSPGGKGANQAVAAARLGARVQLVARVGDDPEADVALALAREAGVDLSATRRTGDERTGLAVITVDRSGENTIVVHPGANSALSVGDLPERFTADAVVAQLEIGLDTVTEAARRTAGLFVLNAAPATRLPDDLLPLCDVIVVNETEYAELADQLATADAVLVRTLGADGAELIRGGAVVARAVPPRVKALDTVGAGDTFVAALTVALCGGAADETALRWACAAAALSTTRRGAQSSMPALSEVGSWRDLPAPSEPPART